MNTKFIDEDTGFVDVIMDPSDSKVLYGASYQRRRTPFGFNGGGPGEGAPGGLSAVRFNWTAPIVISPHNQRIVYLAGNRVWRTLDGGERWTAISPDLTKQIDREKLPIMGVTGEMLAKNDGVSAYGTITAFRMSRGEPPTLPILLVLGHGRQARGHGQAGRDIPLAHALA